MMAETPTPTDVTPQIIASLQKRIGASDKDVQVSLQGPAQLKVIAGDSPIERERQRLNDATSLRYVASFDDPRGGEIKVADRTLSAEQLNGLVRGAIAGEQAEPNNDDQVERLRRQSQAADDATNPEPESPNNGPSLS